ncbi:MAG: hypothetical protein CO189_00275 [candidate division Zixibacteria bacterium CG_4_9_14_3_um_filter_46_8]|nr:MAG: hypothetical protein CO189_00275 [candidate division Zixibacteria bacterium CG_4_9_14_3_um_filter_46_8]
MIDLGSIRYECFIYPDFFSEVAAVYANPASMKLASEEELRSALTKVSAFYYQQFNVNFHSHPSIVIMTAGVPTEILLCLGIVNTGDRVALCDPSDPIFHRAATLSSAIIVPVPISERTDYLPTHELVDEERVGKLKLKFLNYPHNPTGAVADFSFFEAQVKAASKGDYLICHRRGFAGVHRKSYFHPSILQSPAARKVAIESFGFNLGFGLPRGMLEIAAGSPDAIAILREMNFALSNGIPLYILKLIETAIDYFEPVSKATGEKIGINAEILAYELQKLHWRIYPYKGTPFLWASHPRRKSSIDLTRVLLRRAGIMCLPGIIFGGNGEGYVRFSLTASEAEIADAAKRIGKSLHPIRTGKAIINKRIREIRNG